jgi:hypothetical protein
MKKALVIILIFCGCGKSLDGVFRGTESGTQAGAGFIQTVDASISESDGTFTGTWTGSTGTSGTISGKIDGDKLSNISVTQDGCTGSIGGSGTYDGENLYGSVTGTNSCATITAVLSLDREHHIDADTGQALGH